MNLALVTPILGKRILSRFVKLTLVSFSNNAQAPKTIFVIIRLQAEFKLLYEATSVPIWSCNFFVTNFEVLTGDKSLDFNFLVKKGRGEEPSEVGVK